MKLLIFILLVLFNLFEIWIGIFVCLKKQDFKNGCAWTPTKIFNNTAMSKSAMFSINFCFFP